MKSAVCLRRLSRDRRPVILAVSALMGATFAGLGCHAPGSSTTVRPPRLQSVAHEEGAYFVDVTADVGIDYVHSFGDGRLTNMVETVGSGAAFLDYDQDGFMDLYITNNAFIDGVSEGERPPRKARNYLYRNIGGASFEDVTDRAGVGDPDGYGMGVAVADFDNDGYPDIFVCNYGPNVLFRNNGDGTFSDATRRADVAGDANTVGAVWFDFDNDGLLDLYAGNYLDFDPKYTYFYQPDAFPPPMAYPGQPDFLYRNLGGGRFEDVTAAMALHRPEGRMMGVGAADIDDDGWVDLYVANDAMANFLYRNVEGKGFTDVSFRSGVALSTGGEETASMAVDFADFDGDGHVDLFVSDIHFSALYRNEGNGLFRDVTAPSGIAAPSGQYDGWGAAFVDYNNDGLVDIFKVNGALNRLNGQEDQLFENVGGGRFEDVSLQRGSYFYREHVGRGAAFGDYDNDGDVDVAIVNLNEEAVLLRNEGLDQNGWIAIRLVGTSSNRDAVGARVTISAGGRIQVAVKKSAGGYLSTNDPRLFFGLGDVGTIERIEIRWPSGHRQVLVNVPGRQFLTITEDGPEA